jgi:hypothetical protein
MALTGEWRIYLDVEGSIYHPPTLDLYTDEVLDEMIAAQQKFLDAVGFESGSFQ